MIDCCAQIKRISWEARTQWTKKCLYHIIKTFSKCHENILRYEYFSDNFVAEYIFDFSIISYKYFLFTGDDSKCEKRVASWLLVFGHHMVSGTQQLWIFYVLKIFQSPHKPSFLWRCKLSQLNLVLGQISVCRASCRAMTDWQVLDGNCNSELILHGNEGAH